MLATLGRRRVEVPGAGETWGVGPETGGSRNASYVGWGDNAVFTLALWFDSRPARRRTATEIHVSPTGRRKERLRAQNALTVQRRKGDTPMKARMETSIDTLWSNQVKCVVETELDNPHLATTRHLATMMGEALKVLAEELRSENERAALGLAELNARHRRLDDREADLQEREDKMTTREHDAGDRETVIGAREGQQDALERDRVTTGGDED